MTRGFRMTAPTRPGFTVVELLVSIGILGLLMAVTLPAVQRVRESARKTQCTSNLKQILLAQHNHHDAYGVFCSDDRWAGRLAPLLHADMVDRRSPIYICPSDEYANGAWRAYVKGAWRQVGNSYQSNHGTGTSKNQGDGFQGFDTERSARDIADGLSNTAAIAERLVVPDNDLREDPQFFPRRMRSMPRVGSDLAAYVTACRNNTSPPPIAFAIENFYTHVMLPNESSCTDGPSTLPGGGPIAATPSSNHPGGICLALADGSVRFVANTIDLKVWWALGTRAGSETLQSDF